MQPLLLFDRADLRGDNIAPATDDDDDGGGLGPQSFVAGHYASERRQRRKRLDDVALLTRVEEVEGDDGNEGRNGRCKPLNSRTMYQQHRCHLQ